jgi:hypothetical protein
MVHFMQNTSAIIQSIFEFWTLTSKYSEFQGGFFNHTSIEEKEGVVGWVDLGGSKKYWDYFVKSSIS